MTPLVSRMLMLACLCFTLSGVSQAERLVGSGMFCDQPNFRVGQLLTVLIMEMGSGSNTANTNTKRENALDLSASADGGPFTGLPVPFGQFQHLQRAQGQRLQYPFQQAKRHDHDRDRGH